uniref:RNA1 polyprotein n=1 Tax=Cowpea mosaic virus TaxID=12264 RepID=A0A8F2FBN4_CPMV|nr:polyprotein 1 [Cowpea mosaic virus]
MSLPEYEADSEALLSQLTIEFTPGMTVSSLLAQITTNDFHSAIEFFAAEKAVDIEGVHYNAYMQQIRKNPSLLRISVVAYAFHVSDMVAETMSYDVYEFLYKHYALFISNLVTRTLRFKELLLFCKQQYLEKMQASIVWGPELEQYLQVEGEAVAQGISQLLYKMVTWVPTFVRGAVDWSVDAILISFRKHFEKMVQEYVPMAHRVCSWLSQLWDKIVQWISQASETMGWFLDGCRDLMTWGIATLATCSALSLVEKLLVAMGFLVEPFGLSGIFLRTGVVAAACYHYGTNSKGFAEMMALLSLAANCVSTVIVGGFFPGEKDNAQSSPVILLEGLAGQMQNFCETTLTSVGKTCTAVNAISTCCGNLKALAGKILGMLRDFIWKTLGFETRFLADASLLFGEDVDGWLKAISDLRDQFIAKSYCSQDEMMQILVLLEKGRQMRKSGLSKGGISPAIINLILKGINDLEQLNRSCSVQGVRGVRKMPFTIFFQGKSRTGKSLLMSQVTKDFQDHYGLGGETVYSRNPCDQYWSGYRRQPFVLMDDFAAVVTEPSAEAQMINLISSAPYPLNMAGLEEKGICFDSQFVFVSTNFLEVSPEAKVRDDEAFKNRRHVIVQVSNDPAKAYDAANFASNQVYTILAWKDGRYNTVCVIEDYDELVAYLLTRSQQHAEEQEKNLANMMKSATFESHFKSLVEVLELGSMISAGFDIIRPEKLPSEAKEKRVLYSIPYNGEYCNALIDDNYNVTCWFGECVGNPEQLFKYSEKMLLGAYEFLLCSESLNVVIQAHLKEMVCPHHYDKELNFIGKIGETYYHNQMVSNIGSMQKWHRAILFGIGVLLGKEKEKTWYQIQVANVKQALYDMYTKEIRDWPLPIKVTCGIVLAAIGGSAFWKVFQQLVGSGNGPVLMGVAAGAFSAEPQSRKPNRFDMQQYRYNNVPLKRRVWADAQMSLDQSSVAIMSKCRANLVFGGTNLQIVMVPGRRFLACKHFFTHIKTKLRVEIVMDGRRYYHQFDPANICDIPDSELVLYSHPSLEDVSHSCWDLFCWDPDKELPSVFGADFLSCKYNKFGGFYEAQYADIKVRTKKECLTIQSGNYVNKVSRYLEYEAPTIPEDCGSLVIAHIGGKHKIIGVHVAGIQGKIGCASLLPPLEPIAQAQGAEEYFDFLPAEENVSSGVAMVAGLKQGVYIPLPTKTALVETPSEWHLDTPCDKVPSILVPTDPRIPAQHEGYDPAKSGVSKYSQPMSALDPELLGEVANDVLELWHDCAVDWDDFGEVSLEEALNGCEGVEYMERIPLATSEGFPHILSRNGKEKGKRRFVQGDDCVVSLIPGTTVAKAYEELEESAHRFVPALVGIECPKDEKLPMRKVFDKPKTRCFTILPMEYNLVVRRKFLNFVRFIMANRHRLSCQVGINPYSMEWSRLAARMKEKGNDVLCCDYSSFDGLLSKQVMDVIASMINELCGGEDQLKNARRNLLMACCSRLAICKNTVWRVECGIPSGFPMTVIVNSIFNEILIRYHYKKLMREQQAPELMVQSFDKLIGLVTYGDDNLISVNAVVTPYFDGKKLKQSLAQGGVTITDGKDKTSLELPFRRLEECDFLKRTFVQRSSTIWDAPEDKASLWSQLHYVNCNNCEKEVAYLTNVVNVLRELYMHSPREATEFRRKVLKKISWITSGDLPTLAQLQEFYEYQRQQGGADSNDTCDLLTSVDLLGPPLSFEKEAMHGCKVSEEIVTKNLAYYDFKGKGEDEVVFLFNTLYPQSSLPDGCHSVTWSQGSGRGGLPTQSWMSYNISRKDSNINKIIRTAVSSKKRVIFCARDNMVPVNIVALLCAVRNKLMPTAVSNATLVKVMENAKAFKFLPEEFNFAFSDV